MEKSLEESGRRQDHSWTWLDREPEGRRATVHGVAKS